jgi:hypothetical protein
MSIDEMAEKLKKHKELKQQSEFEEAYEKYRKEVEINSGGLVETNRSDFLKQYSFYSTVIHPVLNKYVNAFLGK